MESKDRLKAIVVIWGLFALMVGIMCNVGGTQVEEVVLSLFLALIVLGATMQLSGSEVLDRLVERQFGEQMNHRGKPKPIAGNLDRVSHEELTQFREHIPIREHRLSE